MLRWWPCFLFHWENRITRWRLPDIFTTMFTYLAIPLHIFLFLSICMNGLFMFLAKASSCKTLFSTILWRSKYPPFRIYHQIFLLYWMIPISTQPVISPITQRKKISSPNFPSNYLVTSLFIEEKRKHWKSCLYSILVYRDSIQLD